jgi:hypothetical protein
MVEANNQSNRLHCFADLIHHVPSNRSSVACESVASFYARDQRLPNRMGASHLGLNTLIKDGTVLARAEDVLR